VLGSDVPLDPDMIYTDARLSQHYPTVEIRIADVCLDACDTVLLAALCRALVEKAAREHAAGEPPPLVSTTVLRLASWHASRTGVEKDLLDPVSCRPRPAHDVVDDLVAHVAPVLDEYGDLGRAEQGTRRILAHGTGARHQRELLARTGDLDALVDDLVRRTAGDES
jgi:glutamate---cysteine ligase / carboxylate-amine ligase